MFISLLCLKRVGNKIMKLNEPGRQEIRKIEFLVVSEVCIAIF